MEIKQFLNAKSSYLNLLVMNSNHCVSLELEKDAFGHIRLCTTFKSAFIDKSESENGAYYGSFSYVLSTRLSLEYNKRISELIEKNLQSLIVDMKNLRREYELFYERFPHLKSERAEMLKKYGRMA